MNKVFSVLLSLVMLISIMSVGVVAVSAASTPDSQVLEAYAGETIQIKFIEDNCYGVSGDIEYSNRNLFSSLTPNSSSYGKITESKFILSSFDKVNCEVILTVKIADTAKVGDTCVVSFTNCELVEDNETFEGRSGYTKTVTVKIVKKPTTTTTKKPTTTTKKPTTTTTTGKKPTTNGTTQKPTTATGTNGTTGTTVPVANLDLTELNQQIDIAEALDEDEYTAGSWAQLQSALKAAIKARSAKTQNEVNKAADALRKAIGALEKIDASALEQMVADVNAFLKDNDLTTVWEELHAALNEANIALKSGDQSLIDGAYARLNAAFKAMKVTLDELSENEVIVQEVEVQGECGEDCHVWWHYLLLILLIISAILNVVFIVLVVLYFVKKKQNATDNTPFVDYDINDDLI